MTLAFGDYEQSYPPEILHGYSPPLVSGAAARGAPLEEGDDMEPTTPPPEVGPESNAPEGAVPVESTRTEPDGPAVVAVPADQLDETAAGAEPTPTVRAASVRETALDDGLGEHLEQQSDAGTVLEDEQRSNAERTGAVDDDAGAGEGTDEGDGESDEGDEDAGARFTVAEGAPGTYDPEVSARDRPRNVTELRAFARPESREPWARGSYVLVGTTGKRAHWSGDDWHGDESPGYGESDDSLDDEPDENPSDE